MSQMHPRAFSWAVAAVLAMGCGRAPEGADSDFVYRIETGGVLSGYATVDTTLVVTDGVATIQLEQNGRVAAKLLGSELNNEFRLSYLLDAADKRVLEHRGESRTGAQTADWGLEVREGRADFHSSFGPGDQELELSDEVLVQNPLFFDFVLRDFLDTELSAKTYRTLDVPDFVIRDARYERQSEETLELAGRRHDVLVVDEIVEATGRRTRLWIDTDTGMAVKILQRDGHVVTLSDPSVIAKVERVHLDPYILDETNVAIADVPGIEFMKVRARIRPVGLKPTPESLNVPGQKFTGTVVDNLVEGVFEIEHRRYDGGGAPDFPVTTFDPALEEYLSSDGIFEADDVVLVAKARELTADAANTWEAATRLATWVSDEINYAIPGGGTARRTFDMRAGECGAHSVLLATFCRAVGIPARMVWGCMYTPEKAGVFGQHGWTEVYMGDAGWIPVDATAGETDYVDSGHIRIGAYASLSSRLNAQEFEILDYRIAGGTQAATEAAEERFAPYLGDYEQPDTSQKASIRIQDGSPVLDLQGKAMLALHPPDGDGRWRCKISRHLYAIFEGEGLPPVGGIHSFTLHETYSLPRRSVPESTDDAPPELRRCLGAYYMAALDADFVVGLRRGQLELQHPRQKRPWPLTRVEGGNRWKVPNTPYFIEFVEDEGGRVESLIFDAATRFRRRG